MRISATNYRRCIANYEKMFALMDSALYRLCRENPDHTHNASVRAKLWIIGRTYATGIERGIISKGLQGDSMSQIADFILKHGSKVNAMTTELTSIKEPLTPDNIAAIVSIHGRFVNLLCSISRNGHSTRSFVSKYLHFHNSAVPIYDSVAAAAIRGVVRWKSNLEVFPMPSGADREYGWYVMRFFDLYQRARKSKLRPTVRHIDQYLLSLAGSGHIGQSMPHGA